MHMMSYVVIVSRGLLMMRLCGQVLQIKVQKLLKAGLMCPFPRQGRRQHYLVVNILYIYERVFRGIWRNG